MKRSLGTLLMAGALALGACDLGERDDRDAGDGVDVDTSAVEADSLAALGSEPGVLSPINRSGVRGEARLETDGDEVLVDVRASGLEAGLRYPAHVHEGRCVDGGPVALPLGGVTAREDGTGTLRMRVGADRLPEDADIFIQLHAPDGNPVSCADIAADRAPEDAEDESPAARPGIE